MATTYVSFTYLDALTGAIFDQRTSKGGPVNPAGCVYDFALESAGPTPTPTFFGTTTGRTDILGILRKFDSKADYDAAKAAEMAAREANRVADASAAVDVERDRRIDAGITFQGTVFQTDDTSRERIEKARVSALTALQSGVQAGDMKWTGVGSDFFWIALDNTRVPMDAPTTVAFGSAVAAREGLIIVAASDLKKRIAAGETIANIGDDALWP